MGHLNVRVHKRVTHVNLHIDRARAVKASGGKQKQRAVREKHFEDPVEDEQLDVKVYDACLAWGTATQS